MKILVLSNVIRSDEGLTLVMSAFQIFHGGNSTFINSFDKTKVFRIKLYYHTSIKYGYIYLGRFPHRVNTNAGTKESLHEIC